MSEFFRIQVINSRLLDKSVARKPQKNNLQLFTEIYFNWEEYC